MLPHSPRDTYYLPFTKLISSSSLRSIFARRSCSPPNGPTGAGPAASPSARAVEPQPPLRASQVQKAAYGLFLARLKPAGISFISLSHFSQIFVTIRVAVANDVPNLRDKSAANGFNNKSAQYRPSADICQILLF